MSSTEGRFLICRFPARTPAWPGEPLGDHERLGSPWFPRHGFFPASLTMLFRSPDRDSTWAHPPTEPPAFRLKLGREPRAAVRRRSVPWAEPITDPPTRDLREGFGRFPGGGVMKSPAV